MGLFGSIFSTSDSKDQIKNEIEIHKRNIEHARFQISAERERVANCRRNKTNYNKSSSDSLIASCKRTIESEKEHIDRLRERLKSCR